MPGRATRRCKETLLQVKERLTREQADRTRKRVAELLASKENDSGSSSEEEQDCSIWQMDELGPYCQSTEM
jgi:hypothetical protein